MLNTLLYFFIFLFSLPQIFLLHAEPNPSSPPPPPLSHYILVSVAPHRFFVQKIAGDNVEVGLMVPAGASAHTYEPSPKQMIAAGKADIWFRIGETFENKAAASLQAHHESLQIIDLRRNLDLISDPTHACCHHKDCMDLHFWLSPRQARIQAQTIADTLIATYPEHAQLYRDNLVKFTQELDKLDQQIIAILEPLQNRTVMISHPAYGYFARDYDLEQLSIEFEGKDPTPQQLTRILESARKAHITTIFVQPQYSNKGAALIAREIGAEVVSLDPYSENYDAVMLDIARHFANQ